MPRLIAMNSRWRRGEPPLHEWKLWLDDGSVVRVYNRGRRDGRWCEVEPEKAERRVFVSVTGARRALRLCAPAERVMDERLLAQQWREAARI